MIRKGQVCWLAKDDVLGQRAFIHHFTTSLLLHNYLLQIPGRHHQSISNPTGGEDHCRGLYPAG